MWLIPVAFAPLLLGTSQPTLFGGQELSDQQDKKKIEVKSPWGWLNAVSATPGELGLLLYPGAKLVKEDEHKNDDSLRFDLRGSNKTPFCFRERT